VRIALRGDTLKVGLRVHTPTPAGGPPGTPSRPTHPKGKESSVKDERYRKLARVLVNYSVEVKRGDLVEIGGATITEPLLREVYREVLEAGGHPYTRVRIPGLAEIYLKNAKKHQIEHVSPILGFAMERIDKSITIWADENTKALANVDPKRQSARSAATRALFMRLMEREAAGELKWVGTQFPCQASAQDAEMSLDEYEDFVLRACLVHLKDPVAAWKRVHSKQAKICKVLDTKKKIRVVAKGTDLSMNVAGRKWINCDGKANMPDGEIFTGPIEDSVEGTISFSYPGFYYGREAEGIKLTFKKGKVTKASATKNEDFLVAMLDTDEGARRVGEFAIGTNAAIQTFTRNTLFDEKIGGTIHMALGASPRESGGVNESGIHWDIVNDMRDGGKIYADGKIVYRNGEFTVG
jgi:aminopeptidase